MLAETIAYRNVYIICGYSGINLPELLPEKTQYDIIIRKKQEYRAETGHILIK